MPFFRSRVVICSETSAGDKLDVPFVKSLSGGDKIQARNLYKNDLNFVFRGLLVIHTNSAPDVLTPDDGLRRRLLVIPFHERRQAPDPHFEGTVELSHVVRWILEGVQSYIERGLDDVPVSVRNAGSEFHASSSDLAGFVSERLTPDREAVPVRMSVVFQEYERYCESAGIRHTLTKRGFIKRLRESSLVRTAMSHGHISVSGMRLVSDLAL